MTCQLATYDDHHPYIRLGLPPYTIITHQSKDGSRSKAIGDVTRNFCPLQSDEADNLEPSSPNFHSTPTGGRLSFDILDMHRLRLHGRFSVVLGSNSWHDSHESVSKGLTKNEKHGKGSMRQKSLETSGLNQLRQPWPEIGCSAHEEV
ncbi:hypothetical protein TNCV_3025281 [Trichonephila clavipes]|nr:hypothetical protein TNCV_3025281 [Trichonephila clavipes]